MSQKFKVGDRVVVNDKAAYFDINRILTLKHRVVNIYAEVLWDVEESADWRIREIHIRKLTKLDKALK